MSLNLVQLQGYRPALAGMAFMPLPLPLILLSRWAGGLSDRYGFRLPLIIGPVITGFGFLGLSFIGLTTGPEQYWFTFLPAMLTIGLGLTLTVVPLTNAVMGSVATHYAGTASGINNAISRTAAVLALAYSGVGGYCSVPGTVSGRGQCAASAVGCSVGVTGECGPTRGYFGAGPVAVGGSGSGTPGHSGSFFNQFSTHYVGLYGSGVAQCGHGGCLGRDTTRPCSAAQSYRAGNRLTAIFTNTYTMVVITELTNAQANQYKAFLLTGLRDHADFFRLTAADEQDAPFPTIGTEDSFTLLATDETDTWLGVVSFEREGRNRQKLRHKGLLFRMYVAKTAAGQGIGRALIEQVIGRARQLPALEQINLTVATHNIRARHLYESLGFVCYGTEPNALKLNGSYADESSYQLMLTNR